MVDLLTIAEVADRLRVSARTVEREIAVGRLRRQHALLSDAYGPPERRSPAGT